MISNGPLRNQPSRSKQRSSRHRLRQYQFVFRHGASNGRPKKFFYEIIKILSAMLMLPQLLKWLLLLLIAHWVMAESPFCFHFTWIGPYENKSRIGRESCQERVGEYNDIPCEMPLVATANDTVPDATAIWQNETINRDAFLCHMTAGFSCVKYSYIFKGGIQNITYMCARVNSTNGCYRQNHPSGMKVEACVCTSKVGLIPCNSATSLRPVMLYQILGLAVCLLNALLFLNKHSMK